MGHPLIDEFCRAHELQPTFFRRCQREFRSEVQPLLDQREVLIVENADLKAQLAEVTAKLEAKKAKGGA